MAKAVKHSEMAKEIKKDYLLRHLDEVEKLITEWIPQINAPAPFLLLDDNWGWLSVYRSTLEEIPDSKHVIRQHLRNRTLWKHHAEWERKLEATWDLITKMRKKANDVYTQLSINQSTLHREHYVGVALTAAFNSIYTGKPVKIQYQIAGDQHGVSCGDFKIEMEATTDEERLSIQKGHTNYTKTIAGYEEMKQLIVIWHDVEVLQKQMKILANKIIRAKDILYSCRFCRHLWK
ncbi:hypothetical protein ACFLYI_01170 [Chloroflexota bacterium]